MKPSNQKQTNKSTNKSNPMVNNQITLTISPWRFRNSIDETHWRVTVDTQIIKVTCIFESNLFFDNCSKKNYRFSLKFYRCVESNLSFVRFQAQKTLPNFTFLKLYRMFFKVLKFISKCLSLNFHDIVA